MQDGKSTARETQLLTAADVAGMIGVKESTVYRWCSEGKLPCLKIGYHWRIRRRVLEDFLSESERPRTLVGQLDSFLQVPDSVLGIAQNIDILHRLDAAFFRVGEARGGLLVKFYAGEEHSEEELLSDFEENGLEARRLKREGRLLMRAEEEPLGGTRAEQLGLLIEEEAGGECAFGDHPGLGGGIVAEPRDADAALLSGGATPADKLLRTPLRRRSHSGHSRKFRIAPALCCRASYVKYRRFIAWHT